MPVPLNGSSRCGPRRFEQIGSAIATWLSGLVTILLGRRGLFGLLVFVLVLPGMVQVLRPPISSDISGFSLPLLGAGDSVFSAAEFVRGSRPLLLFSPGSVLAIVAIGCIIAVVARPRSLPWAAGSALAVLLACEATVLLNHPAVVAELDRESELRESIITMLEETAEPFIDITSYPRVRDLPSNIEPGSIASAVNYRPRGRGMFVVLALLGVLLVSAGPFHRRLGFTMVWCLIGATLAFGLTWRRCVAEWHWQRAELAEARGQLRSATGHIDAAEAYFPEFSRLERTWFLRGAVDYQSARKTSASTYFTARQWARSGQLAQAVQTLATLEQPGRAAGDRHPPWVARWLADVMVRMALVAFTERRYESADQFLDQALVVDPSVPERSLCLAVLRARKQAAAPDHVAALLDPVVDRLADRSLRAALLAMLGDCYFSDGQFSEARRRHQASLAAYSLPKTINYRALRGLLGL